MTQSECQITSCVHRQRIQAERKQHVVSTGVYGFVRHPMYLGAACMFFGTPLLLCSTAGLPLA